MYDQQQTPKGANKYIFTKLGSFIKLANIYIIDSYGPAYCKRTGTSKRAAVVVVVGVVVAVVSSSLLRFQRIPRLRCN